VDGDGDDFPARLLAAGQPSEDRHNTERLVFLARCVNARSSPRAQFWKIFRTCSEEAVARSSTLGAVSPGAARKSPGPRYCRSAWGSASANQYVASPEPPFFWRTRSRSAGTRVPSTSSVSLPSKETSAGTAESRSQTCTESGG